MPKEKTLFGKSKASIRFYSRAAKKGPAPPQTRHILLELLNIVNLVSIFAFYRQKQWWFEKGVEKE